MTRLAFALLLALAATSCRRPTPAVPAAVAEAPAPAEVVYAADAGRFEVRGLPAGAAGTLSVRVGDAGGLLGTSGVDAGVPWFKPRFPAAPDVPHAVEFRPVSGDPVRATVTLTRPETPRVALDRVAPTADELPENLLKFYLHFTGPMRRGEAARRVRLLQADGTPVELPFLELDEELWDGTGTRLTLLIDPGRIKRGLKPREDDGPVLEVGKRYTLEVDAGWPDAAGRPLAAGVRKPFVVIEPVPTRLDATAWLVRPPLAPDARLHVRFPAPLDAALLEHALTVVDDAGKAVPGKATVGEAEASWSFAPSAPWAPGGYRLKLAPTLEDLAGNRPDRAFDADGSAPEPGPPTLELPFRVGK